MIAAADQASPGLIMALEQSIVMGIALAWLFVRMLTRVRARGAARRALRGLTVQPRAVLDRRGPSRHPSPRHVDVAPERHVARDLEPLGARRSDGGPAGKRASKSPQQLELSSASSTSGAAPRARRQLDPAPSPST